MSVREMIARALLSNSHALLLGLLGAALGAASLFVSTAGKIAIMVAAAVLALVYGFSLYGGDGR